MPCGGSGHFWLINTARYETLQFELSKYFSLINLGEVLYIVERERGLVAAQRNLAALDQLPIRVVPVTRSAVLAAARLKARYSIS